MRPMGTKSRSCGRCATLISIRDSPSAIRLTPANRPVDAHLGHDDPPHSRPQSSKQDVERLQKHKGCKSTKANSGGVVSREQTQLRPTPPLFQTAESAGLHNSRQYPGRKFRNYRSNVYVNAKGQSAGGLDGYTMWIVQVALSPILRRWNALQASSAANRRRSLCSPLSKQTPARRQLTHLHTERRLIECLCLRRRSTTCLTF
jgi:hypothetical protein